MNFLQTSREKNFNEQEFKQLTRFDFSMKESATTQKNAALMREREVQYKDGVYNISPHFEIWRDAAQMFAHTYCLCGIGRSCFDWLCW